MEDQNTTPEQTTEAPVTRAEFEEMKRQNEIANKRVADNQAAYTRSQQELAETRRLLEERKASEPKESDKIQKQIEDVDPDTPVPVNLVLAHSRALAAEAVEDFKRSLNPVKTPEQIAQEEANVKWQRDLKDYQRKHPDEDVDELVDLALKSGNLSAEEMILRGKIVKAGGVDAYLAKHKPKPLPNQPDGGGTPSQRSAPISTMAAKEADYRRRNKLQG